MKRKRGASGLIAPSRWNNSKIYYTKHLPASVDIAMQCRTKLILEVFK